MFNQAKNAVLNIQEPKNKVDEIADRNILALNLEMEKYEKDSSSDSEKDSKKTIILSDENTEAININKSPLKFESIKNELNFQNLDTEPKIISTERNKIDIKVENTTIPGIFDHKINEIEIISKPNVLEFIRNTNKNEINEIESLSKPNVLEFITHPKKNERNEIDIVDISKRPIQIPNQSDYKLEESKSSILKLQVPNYGIDEFNKLHKNMLKEKNIKPFLYQTIPTSIKVRLMNDSDWKDMIEQYLKGNFEIINKLHEKIESVNSEIELKNFEHSQKLLFERERDVFFTANLRSWKEISLGFIISVEEGNLNELDKTMIASPGMNPYDYKYFGFIIQEFLNSKSLHPFLNMTVIYLYKYIMNCTRFNYNLLHENIQLSDCDHKNFSRELGRNHRKYVDVENVRDAVFILREYLSNEMGGLLPLSVFKQFVHNFSRNKTDENVVLKLFLPYIVCPDKAALLHGLFRVVDRLCDPKFGGFSDRLYVFNFFLPCFFGKSSEINDKEYLNDFYGYISDLNVISWPYIGDYCCQDVEIIRYRMFNL